MVLGGDDFVGRRIDWSDKASNIVDLVASLNIGLQSVVFIDDSPYERSRVREVLPEVYVPPWPADPTEYTTALRSLDCFDVLAVSDTERRRTELYATERERAGLQRIGSRSGRPGGVGPSGCRTEASRGSWVPRTRCCPAPRPTPAA
jgi:predicted enzyme involved in methoxymalonyl-ACP biosynthesis